MDKFKGIAKKGWHPEKEGGIRNSMKGMIGRGDSSKSSSSYSSTPYVKKDPSTFAPPPPTRQYGEGGRPVPAPRPQANEPAASTSATGAPAASNEDVEEPTYETGPFVINKSGKDISKFAPPPPTRRGGTPSTPSSSRIQTPAQSQSQTHTKSPVPPAPAPRPAAALVKPNLPPRLPPRQPSTPTIPAAEQTPSNGHLNQTAISRLGSSGIKVPGFGIGNAPAAPALPSSNAATGGLTATNPPSTGTTWAEKQAAIKTANQLRTNPNAVSLNEVRGAATTAKNFQDRHGDQVASGVQATQQANQKYNIADRVNQLSIASGKGAPPPIPAKKVVNANGPPAPPPLPMASKPRPA